MIRDQNYSGKTVPSEIDDEYQYCNFSQPSPDMQSGQAMPIRLFPGDDTPRVFRYCNLANCLPPPGSVVDHCTTFLCRGGVVIRQDQVNIGSTVIDIPIYGFIAYGYVHPQTLAVVYYSTPKIMETGS